MDEQKGWFGGGGSSKVFYLTFSESQLRAHRIRLKIGCSVCASVCTFIYMYIYTIRRRLSREWMNVRTANGRIRGRACVFVCAFNDKWMEFIWKTCAPKVSYPVLSFAKSCILQAA